MSDDAPPPDLALDLIEAFRRSKTMFAAVRLGVFESLAEGPARAEDLAVSLDLHPGAAARLLAACAALGLIDAQGDTYAMTPVALTYLTRGGSHSLVGYIDYSNDGLWHLWAHLEDAVREGSHRWEQVFGGSGPLFSHYFRSEEGKRAFLMGMHGYGSISSPRVVAAFDLGRFRRLVDLGGATGHLALAACRRWPTLRAVVFDLPEVAPVAREVVGAAGLADRVDVVAGDFFQDELPECDLVALGRILHDWADAKVGLLLEKIAHRLPEGGGLLIAETLLDEDGPGPRLSRMQDLNMLCATEGRERTLAGYETLLTRAGFTSVQGRRTGAPVDAVFALRD